MSFFGEEIEITFFFRQTLLYASSLSVSTSALPGAAVGLDAFDFAFGALPGLFGDHRTVSLFFFAGERTHLMMMMNLFIEYFSKIYFPFLCQTPLRLVPV